ncbi:MAG TPA: DNA polymerase Y family protein [Dokdonella sp.]
MLWACLRFPLLALDALTSGDAMTGAAACAVVDGQQQRRHVVLANAPARNAGVRAGQPLAAARALCPRLAALPRDAAAERQALETLASRAYRYSGEIHVAAPDAVLLEAGASLTLFGGWPALECRLRGDFAACGFAHALAAAPTAAAARVFAAGCDGFAVFAADAFAGALGRVPIGAAGFTAPIAAALHGMGFRRLRELFDLPRAELARRIGADAVRHLDRLRGRAAEALPRWRPPARYERRLELAYGVESRDALAFPLQRLIRELALFLTARDGGVQRFALELGHERATSTRVEIGLLAPQRDAARLFEVARAQLEHVELPAPVHALTLSADDLPSLDPQHRDLFDDRRHEPLDWAALVERLRARLGPDALHGLACVADHRPDHAWRFVPLASEAPAAGPPRRTPSASAASASAARARPFWLLRRPLKLREPPRRVLAGPERIESGWWDGSDRRRDYYVVETQPGRRAWAFTRSGDAREWLLHGWFA